MGLKGQIISVFFKNNSLLRNMIVKTNLVARLIAAASEMEMAVICRNTGYNTKGDRRCC